MFFDIKEIQVDFEANAINEDDYHGICRLLQQVGICLLVSLVTTLVQLFLKAPVNLSEVATCIVNQSHIGSVIKVMNYSLIIIIHSCSDL